MADETQTEQQPAAAPAAETIDASPAGGGTERILNQD